MYIHINMKIHTRVIMRVRADVYRYKFIYLQLPHPVCAMWQTFCIVVMICSLLGLILAMHSSIYPHVYVHTRMYTYIHECIYIYTYFYHTEFAQTDGKFSLSSSLVPFLAFYLPCIVSYIHMYAHARTYTHTYIRVCIYIYIHISLVLSLRNVTEIFHWRHHLFPASPSTSCESTAPTFEEEFAGYSWVRVQVMYAFARILCSIWFFDLFLF